jgi:hypothetical protein
MVRRRATASVSYPAFGDPPCHPSGNRQHDGARLELVEGPTLADRIAQALRVTSFPFTAAPEPVEKPDEPDDGYKRTEEEDGFRHDSGSAILSTRMSATGQKPTAAANARHEKLGSPTRSR